MIKTSKVTAETRNKIENSIICATSKSTVEAGLAAETGSECYGHVMGDYSLVRRTQNEV